MHKKTIKMIVLIVIAAILGKTAYSIKQNDNLNRFEQGIQYGVLTMTKILVSPITYIKDTFNKANKCPDYSNNSISLNTELYIQEQDNTIKELRNLLEMEENSPIHIVNSDIITYNHLNQTLIINKGEKQGIKKDMLVINKEGLIGFIYSCSQEYSTVNLLMGENNFKKMSVKVQNSEQNYGILSAYNQDHQLYILQGINNTSELSIGSLVVTSGINNNEPSGILVGYIESFISDQNGLETKMYVRPVSRNVDYKVVGVIIND